jgi:hypothetical protein
VRVLVLWSACRGVEAGQDASWAEAQLAKLAGGDGIAAIALHAVGEASTQHTPPGSWCLELRLAEGYSPRQLIRARPWREFLGDLRLLGMQPRVMTIEKEL